MSSKQFLIDAATRHQVLVQRYAASLEKEYGLKVSRALTEASRVLADIDDALSRPDDIKSEALRAFNDKLELIEQQIYQELESFTDSEAEFSTQMLDQAVKPEVTAPSQMSLSMRLRETPIDVQVGAQMTIRQALSQYSRAKQAELNQIISDGFTDGTPAQQLIRRIREQTKLYARQAGALVRTGVNAASALARMETLLANSELLDGYEWVSTLDRGTTFVCMSRDGKVYQIIGGPVPPAHWGCRSTIIPRVKPDFDLGASLNGTRPSANEDGVEEVGGNVTYGGWLRNQSVEFQKEVLGESRYKLFNRGGLTIDKFVDPLGRTYNLQQLKALNPLAFDKAGLN